MIGTATVGLKVASENFNVWEETGNFLGTAIVTGLLLASSAWVVFDFIDDPSSSRR